jgi:hypothetical protein
MTHGKIIQSVGGDSGTFIIILEVKVKGSQHRPKAQGGVEFSSTLSLTSALDWGGWLAPRPGRFTPGKGRSGRTRKISSLPGFDPRTVQTVESRYTDYIIPVHIINEMVLLNSIYWDDNKLHENTGCWQLKHVHVIATWEPKQVQAQTVLECATWNQGRTQKGVLMGWSPPYPQNRNINNADFVHITSKVLRDFPFSRNQPLKSADG